MNFGMKTNSLSAVLLAGALLVGGSCQIIAQDSSTKFKDRYAKWQESHPFTLGVMSYDMAYLPHWYENAKPGLVLDPKMDVFRQAGLNLLDDVSMSAAGHMWYPGVRAAHKAKVQYMILGAGWSGLPDFQHRVIDITSPMFVHDQSGTRTLVANLLHFSQTAVSIGGLGEIDGNGNDTVFIGGEMLVTADAVNGGYEGIVEITIFY